MMGTFIKRLSIALSDGMLFSGRPTLEEMDLARDFADVERLVALEEWPFLRSDLEISHAQPRAVAWVARKEGRFAGFFACHHFGDVGYLDMMIIDPAFRRAGIARPLYFRTVRAMKAKGLRDLVVHTTTDSARLIRLLGFRAGQTFTLLARDPVGAACIDLERAVLLGSGDADALVALDATIFGAPRPTWVAGLLAQPGARFHGLFRDGALRGSLCLRSRRGGALALDGANALDFGDLGPVVEEVLGHFADHRLECFVKDGSALDGLLRRRGFRVPDFFTPIGPLVEWRKGTTKSLGLSPLTQCLSWF